MPVFFILLAIATVVIWLCAVALFKPLGNLINKYINKLKKTMEDIEIAQSLTPELLEKIKYERWNGQVPTVSGSNAIVSIDGVN